MLVVGTVDVWIVTHEDLRHVPRVRAVMEHLGRAFRAGPRSLEWRLPGDL